MMLLSQQSAAVEWRSSRPYLFLLRSLRSFFLQDARSGSHLYEPSETQATLRHRSKQGPVPRALWTQLSEISYELYRIPL